jgi:pyruvate-ferredoxin/flavodoxin oxidoreductase
MRLAIDQNKKTLRSLMAEIGAATKEELEKSDHPRAALALSLWDAASDKSVWIVGGDGWAYDIGYGGLDHVLHSGANVNVLVLDTEGYSNTGGQMSKSTPFGASMKFAVGGKERAKKDLGLIAMMSGAYVAQIALGANQVQAVRAFQEAAAFDGPSIILAYCPCIAHGFPLAHGARHQSDLVATGAWPLYRFNPALIAQDKNPLSIDSRGGELALEEFLKTENRFAAAASVNKNFDKIIEWAKKNNAFRSRLKEHIAEFTVKELTIEN